MDTISITNLAVQTPLGITEQERSSPQEVHVSVHMYGSTKNAGASDAIEDTIDYAVVASAIEKLAVTERNTIEKFAEDIADHILEHFNPESVTVHIKKFILPNAESVSVAISRP